MLKRRLIPKLQLKRSRLGRMVLVTTVRFGESIEVGDPVSQARVYEAQAADELIFLDLEAGAERRDTMVDIVRKVAEQVFMPITVGGGVRTLEDFRTLLSGGADKVSLNTAALDDPDLINRAAESFGSSTVVVSIDYDADHTVCLRGEPTPWRVLQWAQEAERRGAGELLLTSRERDGTRQGLDLEITRQVARAVSIPVITAGGCGVASDFVAGFLEGQADAVAAGTYFCSQDQTPMQCRAHISNAGIPVRLHT